VSKFFVNYCLYLPIFKVGHTKAAAAAAYDDDGDDDDDDMFLQTRWTSFSI